MKKSDTDTTIQLTTTTTPSKKEAEQRIKNLSNYLQQIWSKTEGKK